MMAMVWCESTSKILHSNAMIVVCENIRKATVLPERLSSGERGCARSLHVIAMSVQCQKACMAMVLR